MNQRTNVGEEQSKTTSIKIIEPEEKKKEDNPLHVYDDATIELARMEQENRRFGILKRERAMTDEQRKRNRASIMAGVCILGAATAVYFNGQDVHQVLQHELNAIYSWEALGQYIKDLGPLTTLLAASAGAFIAKYVKHSRKYKEAQNEFIDYHNSLEGNIELGGEENDRTR